MSTDSKSLPVHEMDTNLLFEKFTVEEIRNIEKRTRSDIERKKEDLRTMVGERYRDLIEAADTISEMKQSSLNVMSTIDKIDSLCNELKQSHMVRGSSLHQKRKQEMENKKKEEARFYGVAAQIKLLLDIPEKVWTCLDCEDYLSASRLYLLSQHINTSLHLDSQQTPNFLYWFPVLNRQWAAISHFKFTILQGCRRLLKEPAVPDQKIAESLCSILLLENSNPRQVFNEFLLARTGAVQQLFHGSNESASTKDQICTVVQLVTTTIHQIHTVFYNVDKADTSESQEPCNLLLNILTEVTSQKQCDSGLLDLQTSVSARCLPKSVTDFCPSHKSVSMGVSEQHLHDNCKQWIQTCSGDVKAGVSKLLNFVNTVKHLATIRDTVWDLMAKDPSLAHWPEVCQRVLSTTLHIWEDLLQPLFVDRVQALIQYQLETSVEMTQRQIIKVVVELDTAPDGSVSAEVDLASYIWSESPGDLAAHTAWGSQGSAGSRSLLDSGGLMMKAKAFTPVTQSLCKMFDERLCAMYEDCKFYLFTDLDTLMVATETTPFNRYSDTTSLLSFIQKSCVQGVKRMLKFLTDLVNECKSALSSANVRCLKTGNKLLLAGRFCAAMCELMVHLQQCMMGSEMLQKPDRSSMKRSTSGRLGGKADVCSVWETAKTELLDFQKTAYKLWVDHLVLMALKDFSKAVHAQTCQDVIRTSARWDEVAIEEETEDGKKVTSKISVPVQASWYVMHLLYGLCSDLNHIGCHAVDREVLEHLVSGVSSGIADVYNRLFQKRPTDAVPINQHWALQLLFDVKFTLLIFPRRDDSKPSKQYLSTMERVVSRLEEKVDPFDLDVFSPYMQTNLSKLAQRSAVLLGGLTSVDKSGFYSVSSRVPVGTQQEQHNMLLLSSCHSRFPLLPLSSQSSRYHQPQPVLAQTLYRGTDTSGGPSLAETAAAVIPQHSQQKMHSTSSFYDKIGSMTELSHWFSNIGSK